MSIDQIAAAALQLTSKERALLAETLWESVSSPGQASPEMTDQAALALALLRDRELESGVVAPVSHDEIMTRLRR